MTTAILTDSACDLDPQLMLQYGIDMIHSRIVLGNTIRVDRLEVTPEEVIRDMNSSNMPMTTTPPSAAEFDAAFLVGLNTADRILCLNTSAGISGSVMNGREAAKRFGSLVTVLDSQTVSTGLGLRVLRAAQLAAQGTEIPEIVAELNRVAPNSGTWFTVETLKFLQLNGRITSASAFLGGMLRVTPTLQIAGGKIAPAARTVGHQRALSHLSDSLRQQIEVQPHSRVAFLYAPGGEGFAAALRDSLGGLNFQDMGQHALGSAVVANTGPGTVGFSVEPA